MNAAGGLYCLDNGIKKSGSSKDWLKPFLWVTALVAALVFIAG